MNTDRGNSLIAMADRLKRLRAERDALNEQSKDLAAVIKEVETKLSDAMLKDDVPNFKHDGALFYLSNKVHASPIADSKYELFDALREHGFGSLVVETVNERTLASFVKSQREEHDESLPDWLAGLVNVYDQTGVNLRRDKK